MEESQSKGKVEISDEKERDIQSVLQTFEEESSYDGDTSSMYTLQQLVKKDKMYISLNLMIQTEYCGGQTLKDFLHRRGQKICRK